MSTPGAEHSHVRFTPNCEACDDFRVKVSACMSQHPASTPPEAAGADLSDVDSVTVHLDHLDAQMRSERLWGDLEDVVIAQYQSDNGEPDSIARSLHLQRAKRDVRRRIIHWVLMHAHEIDLGASTR